MCNPPYAPTHLDLYPPLILAEVSAYQPYLKVELKKFGWWWMVVFYAQVHTGRACRNLGNKSRTRAGFVTMEMLEEGLPIDLKTRLPSQADHGLRPLKMSVRGAWRRIPDLIGHPISDLKTLPRYPEFLSYWNTLMGLGSLSRRGGSKCPRFNP